MRPKCGQTERCSKPKLLKKAAVALGLLELAISVLRPSLGLWHIARHRVERTKEDINGHSMTKLEEKPSFPNLRVSRVTVLLGQVTSSPGTLYAPRRPFRLGL